MDITEKIMEAMESIYVFSLSRTPNAVRAEDLSQQIFVELLASRDTLKNENAFYGWMWAVARNTYAKYIRAGKKADFYIGDFDEKTVKAQVDIEADLTHKEDLQNLRRELSLLTRQYRETIVKYYLEEKSCLQISKELSVSLGTVKHLLFKARKILKEALNMPRQYGEKSYNPDIFRFNMWVSDNGAWEKYHNLFGAFRERRLSGNILLSAYYAPLTVEELSVELGVSAPYLEDELNILQKSGFIKLLPRGRYQTNIFVYTNQCDEEIAVKTREIYQKYSQVLKKHTDQLIPAFEENVLYAPDKTLNSLRWFVAHFILWHAVCKKQMEIDPMPLLPLGGRGYLWGHNYEYRKNGISGIYGKCNSTRYPGWIHATNYRLLENCQVHMGASEYEKDFILAAANQAYESYSLDEIASFMQQGFIGKEGDNYKSRCPVMTEAQYQALLLRCAEASDEMAAMLTQIIDAATAVMENHAPAALKEQCRPIAVINNANGMAEIMEFLCESGYLIIPQGLQFLTLYAVV